MLSVGVVLVAVGRVPVAQPIVDTTPTASIIPVVRSGTHRRIVWMVPAVRTASRVPSIARRTMS